MITDEMHQIYMLLDAVGNPIPRANATEANPFNYFTLRDAFKDAELELKNQDAISIVEIKIIQRFDSGM